MSYDYIIVGGGSAGSVLANRLSARSSNKVLVCEAGQDTPHGKVPPQILDSYPGTAYLDPRFHWTELKVTTEVISHNNPQENRPPLRKYEQARVLGGGSSINGQLANRGAPSDYDEWVAKGAVGWGWQDVLPYFRRSENNADRRDANLHGVDGPIHVTFIPKPNRLNQAFLDAFAALGGYRHCNDFTGLDPEGYGLRQGTIHRGRRDSSASALLIPALRRPNLTVLSRSTVTRIRIDAGRVRCWLHARSCCAPARFTRPNC